MPEPFFEIFHGNEISDQILAEASELFNNNYGIWGKRSARLGQRVKLSPSRLKEFVIPSLATSSYVRVTVDDSLVGHAFACRWTYASNKVCWVTQLVVEKTYRERGLATALLSLLKQDDDMYGIASSHPAAILSAIKAFGEASLDSIRQHAQGVISASPVPYIRDAELHGALFDTSTDRLISGLDTNFYVDHEEPSNALHRVQAVRSWQFGSLPEGHEFLLLVLVKSP